jgi:hypothetical protein
MLNENKDTPNKSLQRRRKQLLSYSACVLNFRLSLACFCPAELNRSTLLEKDFKRRLGI